MLWEYFLNFDAADKESIRKSCEYITNISQKFMDEKKLGPDFCRTNDVNRKPNGYGFTQEELNEKYKNAPNRVPLMYQWKVMGAVNPNRLNGSYYLTLDPGAVEKQ